MTDDHERRIRRLEEKLDMTDVAVEALQTAFTNLSSAFTAYTTATTQTIADILAHEAGGGQIQGSELSPVTEGLETLTKAVESATATVSGEDPGAETAAAPDKPVYVHDTDGPTEGWTASGFEVPAVPAVAEVAEVPATTGPTGEPVAAVPAVPAQPEVPAVPLWYFDNDTVGGEPTGAVEGVWAVYTGPVVEETKAAE